MLLRKLQSDKDDVRCRCRCRCSQFLASGSAVAQVYAFHFLLCRVSVDLQSVICIPPLARPASCIDISVGFSLVKFLCSLRCCCFAGVTKDLEITHHAEWNDHYRRRHLAISPCLFLDAFMLSPSASLTSDSLLGATTRYEFCMI